MWAVGVGAGGATEAADRVARDELPAEHGHLRAEVAAELVRVYALGPGERRDHEADGKDHAVADGKHGPEGPQ